MRKMDVNFMYRVLPKTLNRVFGVTIIINYLF